MWRRNAIRAVVVAAGAVAFHYLCVAPYRANLTLIAVEQRTAKAQTLDPVNAALVARTNLDDLAVQPQRLDPNWYLLTGANCELLGRRSDAVDWYSRALNIDQRPELYVSRGLVLQQLGEADAAVRDLVTAARFNPTVVEQLDGDLRARVVAGAGVH